MIDFARLLVLFAILPAVLAPPFSAVSAQEASAENPKRTAPATSPTLNSLFSKLKKERRAPIAQKISRQIQLKWAKSGSDSIDLLSNWAREAIANKKYPVALDLLDQVTTLKPEYAEGWNLRATLHFVMKNYGKSLGDVERVLALEPRHFGAIAGLGLIFQKLGQKERALAAWHRVLELYPAMSNAQKAVIDLEEAIAAKRI